MQLVDRREGVSDPLDGGECLDEVLPYAQYLQPLKFRKWNDTWPQVRTLDKVNPWWSLYFSGL